MNEETKIPAGAKPRRSAYNDRDSQREPIRESSDKPMKMRAKPNWESVDTTTDDNADKLHIDRSLIPEGMDLQWVTTSVYGQDVPQHRSTFERKGWTPVHQDDFDGQFDGMFMAKGAEGEINNDGLVLMARPLEMTKASKRKERAAALEQVAIKEQALRGGDLPIGLDATHPSALRTNRVNKTMERIEVPKD
jgi:hypothetical protein